jgi:hypothetical protein
MEPFTMTRSWDEVLLTCIHGVREGLDYHDCPECKKMALDDGLPWVDKKDTWIYTEEYMRRRDENKK